MYATTWPSRLTTTFAPSCLKRPIAVCFTGVERGSYGSISTIQPKRFGSLA